MVPSQLWAVARGCLCYDCAWSASVSWSHNGPSSTCVGERWTDGGRGRASWSGERAHAVAGSGSGGRGGLVLVTGEPGIGKTAVVTHATEDAAVNGVRLLWATCWDGAGAPAYWPWVQVIRSYVRVCDPETLRRPCRGSIFGCRQGVSFGLPLTVADGSRDVIDRRQHLSAKKTPDPLALGVGGSHEGAPRSWRVPEGTITGEDEFRGSRMPRPSTDHRWARTTPCHRPDAVGGRYRRGCAWGCRAARCDPADQ
ncbi:MAG: ATP-binding protein [Pseudonocardiaceae bacterium]